MVIDINLDGFKTRSFHIRQVHQRLTSWWLHATSKFRVIVKIQNYNSQDSQGFSPLISWSVLWLVLYFLSSVNGNNLHTGVALLVRWLISFGQKTDSEICWGSEPPSRSTGVECFFFLGKGRHWRNSWLEAAAKSALGDWKNVWDLLFLLVSMFSLSAVGYICPKLACLVRKLLLM